MTWNKQLLVNYKKFEVPEKVGLGDGCTSDALELVKCAYE